MEFSRHTIYVGEQRDIHQVLKTICGLQNLVAVRIARSADMGHSVFTEETLQSILVDRPESLSIEALPLGSYKKLMRQEIDQAVQSTLLLRAALRRHYAAALVSQVRDYLRQLESMLSMLKCFALQSVQSGLAGHSRKLQDFLGQLAASSFEHGDNVRCMDDLQYQILPTLRILQKIFRK